MAQAIVFHSGSPLIGSPLTYQVTPSAHQSQYTFHRVTLRVTAGLDGDADYTTLDFSTPVTSALPVLFDVSSALRAVAEKYQFTATPPQRYPYIKFRVEAWDEWMVDGNISTNQGVVYWPGTPVGQQQFYAYAFMGAWTDLERMKASVDQQDVEYLDTSVMSRKPSSSPEVVFLDTAFIYPAQFNRSILDTDHMSDDVSPVFVSGAPSDGPKSISYTPQAEGADTVGGHSLYVVPQPTDAYLLRFINGMGCMESLHVESLVKREVPIQTDKHTVARQETLKKFSRSVVRKSNDRETWSLTSGALDREWASWYIHEFLMSEQVWIGLTSNLSPLTSELLWIPCHVVPEETTVLEDLTKVQPYEVQFKLEMDINGSPI